MNIMRLNLGRIFLLGIMLTGCSLDATPPAVPPAAQHNIELGLAYLERGNTSRAQAKLLRAAAQAPRSAMAQSALAYFYMQNGQLDQAEYAYKKSIELAPHSGEMYNNYAVFLCHQGRYAVADKMFMQAVAQPDYPQVADAQQNAAWCAQQAQTSVVEQ